MPWIDTKILSPEKAGIYKVKITAHRHEGIIPTEGQKFDPDSRPIWEINIRFPDVRVTHWFRKEKTILRLKLKI